MIFSELEKGFMLTALDESYGLLVGYLATDEGWRGLLQSFLDMRS